MGRGVAAELGWVGFDPTNNAFAARVTSASRSAATTPTCRRPAASTAARPQSELTVAVKVLAETRPLTADLLPVMTWTAAESPIVDTLVDQQQQQQQ